MAGAGRTLKVSYGSFSCTLEGFDDPVATLRSITEHFQSLSAPERLFAAEGPVPALDLILPAGMTDDPQPTVAAPVAPRAEGAAAARPASGTDRDADVSRLLSQTIGQMEGAEQRRRQATIGHLKAAVAATAEDPAAGLGGDPARADRYRADLASVVRPARAGALRPPPAAERPMPLLLVPELRVPPRPAMADVPPKDSDGVPDGPRPGLADVIDLLDARGLPDMVEAAAAFLLCAGRTAAVTRPEVMRHLSALPAGRGGSPEDQMRGFGVLLRDGRLRRADGGTFTLPDDAPVLARMRALLAG